MNRFREYVIGRRGDLKLSQRELAKAAGMSNNTLAAIEAGRVLKSPDLDTIDCLAKGLRVPPEVLTAIARGKSPEEAWKAYDERKRTAEVLEWHIPDDIPDPVDDWERDMMKRIEHKNWGDFDPRRDDSFWYHDRMTRRRLFRMWESQLEEQEEIQRKRKGRA